MIVLNFIIAVLALIIAILAYRRVVGKDELREQTSALRKKAADALGKMGESLKPKEDAKGNTQEVEGQ